MLLEDMIEKDDGRGRLVVRVSTGYSFNDGLLSQYKRIRVFKSKSYMGMLECFNEDCLNIGPDEVFHKIVNINDVDDGVYEVIIFNESRDWETGYVEEWDYKLIKYIE